MRDPQPRIIRELHVGLFLIPLVGLFSLVPAADIFKRIQKNFKRRVDSISPNINKLI